jgi:hypothetical protein
MRVRPTPCKPLLSWCEDEAARALERIVLERIGKPESKHPLNGAERIDMSHCVIGCGRCGGVHGGDGIVSREGVEKGRCPTKRCTCSRKQRGGGAT